MHAPGGGSVEQLQVQLQLLHLHFTFLFQPDTSLYVDNSGTVFQVPVYACFPVL